MRRALTIFFVVAGVFVGYTARGIASTPQSSGRVRAVVSLVGDSNVTGGAKEIAIALTFRDVPYAVVDLSRGGARVRTGDCGIWAATCSTYNWWSARLTDARAKIQTDAYVVNLGINDARVRGTLNGPGYSQYGGKIDWLMSRLGAKPVFWSTLPCMIEPAALFTGCREINLAIVVAANRWPNLTVIPWHVMANSHPEYLLPNDVHYSPEGNKQYAGMVKGALDKRFPLAS